MISDSNSNYDECKNNQKQEQNNKHEHYQQQQHQKKSVDLSTLFNDDDVRHLKIKDRNKLTKEGVNETWSGVNKLLGGQLNEFGDDKNKRSKRSRIKETAFRMKGNKNLLKAIHDALTKNKEYKQLQRESPANNPDIRNSSLAAPVEWSNFQNPNISLISDRELRTEVTNLLFSQQSNAELLIDFRVPTILEGGYLRVRVKEHISSPKIVYIRPLLITKNLSNQYPELNQIIPLQKRLTPSIRSPHIVGGQMEATPIRSHFGTIHSYNECNYLIPVSHEINRMKYATKESSTEQLKKLPKIKLPQRFSRLACLLHSQSALNPFMRRPYTSVEIKLKRLKISLNIESSVIGQQLQRLIMDCVSPYIVITLDNQPLYRTDCVVASPETDRRKYRLLRGSWQLTILFGISIVIGIHTPWSVLEFVVYDKELHNPILPELSTKIGSMKVPVSKLIPGREEAFSIINTFEVDVFQFNIPELRLNSGSSSNSTSDDGIHDTTFDLITRFAVGNSEQNKIPLKLSLDIDVKLSNNHSFSSEMAACSMAAPLPPDCGSYHGFDLEELTAVLLRISGTIKIAKVCWKAYVREGGFLLIGLWMIILYAFLMAPERWAIPLILSSIIRFIQSFINIMAIADRCLKPLAKDPNNAASPNLMIIGLTDFRENRRQFTRILINALLSIKAEAKLRKISNSICRFYIKLENLSKTFHMYITTNTSDSIIVIPDDMTNIDVMAPFVIERLKLKRRMTTNSRLIRLYLFCTAYVLPETLFVWLRKTSCIMIACLPMCYFLVHHEIKLLFKMIIRGIKAVKGKIKLMRERKEINEIFGNRHHKTAEPKRRPFHLHTM